MFCTASLPRKWSIRKICASSSALCKRLVERARGGEVAPERLLDDQPRTLGEAGGAEHLHHRREGIRRDGEVDQAPNACAELLLGLRDRFQQRVRLLAGGGGEGQGASERLPVLVAELAPPELGERRADLRAEAVGVEGAFRAAGADDPVVRRASSRRRRDGRDRGAASAWPGRRSRRRGSAGGRPGSGVVARRNLRRLRCGGSPSPPVRAGAPR